MSMSKKVKYSNYTEKRDNEECTSAPESEHDSEVKMKLDLESDFDIESNEEPDLL